jgi:hypothetical protein
MEMVFQGKCVFIVVEIQVEQAGTQIRFYNYSWVGQWVVCNNITYKDIADMWISIILQTTLESLFLEYFFMWGYAFRRRPYATIQNDKPIIGQYNEQCLRGYVLQGC